MAEKSVVWVVFGARINESEDGLGETPKPLLLNERETVWGKQLTLVAVEIAILQEKSG
jgi:hypothetical protein